MLTVRNKDSVSNSKTLNPDLHNYRKQLNGVYGNNRTLRSAFTSSKNGSKSAYRSNSLNYDARNENLNIKQDFMDPLKTRANSSSLYHRFGRSGHNGEQEITNLSGFETSNVVNTQLIDSEPFAPSGMVEWDSFYARLNSIFYLLKSRIPEERLSAATNLQKAILSLDHEVSVEEFQQFISVLDTNILQMINSKFQNEKIGGIIAIETLIDYYIHSEELPNHIGRLASYLRKLIPSNDVEVMRMASNTLGKLFASGGSMSLEFVEAEIKYCIEWLTTSPENSSSSFAQEARKHASLLVIIALSKSSPYLLFPYINYILDNIWRALRDTKSQIRYDAAITLGNCLSILQERDEELAQEWCDRLLESCIYGLRINTVASLHATLLVYRELLLLKTPKIQKRYSEVFETTFKLKENKTDLIRQEVYNIFPLLAAYDSELFGSGYINNVMVYYLTVVQNSNTKTFSSKDKASLLVSIGNIACEVGNRIMPYLDPILENVRDSLQLKYRLKKLYERQVFYCIGKVANAVGETLTKYLAGGLLDLILQCPLSDHLQELLKTLIQNTPSLAPIIGIRLLNILSETLSGEEFMPPGSPYRYHHFSAKRARNYRNKTVFQKTNEPNDDAKDSQMLIKALSMLQTIDHRYSLTEFVRMVVIQYIEHDNVKVRKLAATMSCDLFAQDEICKQTAMHALNSVSEVLGKLLAVAIADPVPEVRLDILKHLSRPFDNQLAQPHCIRLLFKIMNDEVFEIQLESTKIIGRLTSLNPGYVLPYLRQTILELLTKISFLELPRKKEEATTLLCTLISCSNDSTRPYIDPILEVLLSKSKDSSSTVASTALKAIGELSVVGGKDMLKHINKLVPLIMNMFRDQSNSFKRDTALKTLGQLSESSSYVIEPYTDYPELLGILVNILRSENSQNIKRATVKLMGTLGALDPYKQKEIEVASNTVSSAEQNKPSIDIALLMQGKSPSSDEYYPTVVMHTLLKIMHDPSLLTHHASAMMAIMNVFQTLRFRCVSFLFEVIPTIISVIESCPISTMEFYFRQLEQLIIIVKQHIRPYVGPIYETIEKKFHIVSLQTTLISITESICTSIEGDFKKYVPQTLMLFVDVLENDQSTNNEVSIKIIKSLVTFGSTLDDFFHLIVQNLMKIAEFSTGPLQKIDILTLGKLARCVDLNSVSSRIIHTLARVLDKNEPEVVDVTMDTVCCLLLKLGSEFMVYVPFLNKILVKHGIHNETYEILLIKLSKNEPLPLLNDSDVNEVIPSKKISEADTNVKKLPINQPVLKNTWGCSKLKTKEDWQDWIRRLSVQLLKESPSHALRACSSLATIYYPLARELFNAAFSSVWADLYTQYQEDLIQSLCTALSSLQNPPEIHQALLNLVEYMEHDEKPLPIPIQTLGLYAERCHAYAKALHYREVKFIKEPENSTIESLIMINNQLHQNDAAIGILKHAQRHHELQLKETWYEKLQRWEDALEAYNKRSEGGEDTFDVFMGRMRSLHALGEWEQLSNLAAEKWRISKPEIRKYIAPLAAGAAWGLGHWENIEQYISVMKPHSPDKEFFEAILCVNNGNFELAERHIFVARDLLVTEISALINESYNRAYGVVVRSQIVAELEEIIQYKKLPLNSEKKKEFRDMWNKRLLGCQKNVDIWQRILRVRTLVVKPKNDMEIWIKFANLCRKSGRLGLAQKALSSLLEEEGDSIHTNTAKAPAPVVYAQLKYLWATGSQDDALHHLISFTSRLAQDLGLDPSNMIAQSVPHETSASAQYVEKYTKLLARCFLKQGEWRVALEQDWRTQNPEAILGSYLLATHFDKTWYKAWHNWALANFEVISLMTARKLRDSDDNLASNNSEYSETAMSNGDGAAAAGNQYSSTLIQRHVVPAIQGFFHSISLLKASSLQDSLRLLTLWFTFGGTPEATQAIHEGFRLVQIGNWLEVLPQLISHIHQPNEVVSNSLLSLLSDLGKAHPQALVYPLTVASKSEYVSWQKAALSIIEKMRLHSPILIDQAELVSHELIRVAVLWHELWYEGLEDASRQFFGEHNTDKMIATLEPLHKLLKNEPATLREASFKNHFGRDLDDAYEWVLNYKRTKDVNNLNQAWDIYYNIFRKIIKQLPQLQTLELQHVSPRLLVAHDLELAVPGTYAAGKSIIRISYFEKVFSVIASKQRPRKFSIRGSDGKDYKYALKGHEDIRQDSLVMQLFGLVNTLLENDAECFQRHLDIQQYPAIPLSPKSGLLGWVPDSDTFHVLIREHRDAKKIPLNIEHWVMLQMAPDYDNLTLLQKIEVFTYAIDNTKGQDLSKVLWLKSKSSEAWLERRTTYTRSLAVMSMVGYILGLGDRHPSNLMLNRITGKVIHIDFGDCFEAAILRGKFPEKVPFRLTRMLTYAMEVSGIEGSYRITCENVMRVLRSNKESLMAILEAFAFDPLIHWGFDLPPQKITEQTGIQLPSANSTELLRKGAITPEEAVELELEYQNEIRNARGVLVLRRITDKLTGNDFPRQDKLDIPGQVDKLIQQATSVENLCQHYIGWCPFW